MLDIECENGDLVLDANGNLILVDSIAQQVYLTFSCWLKSWFYDLTFGIDYQSFVATQAQADLLIKTKLLAIKGVISIINFTSSLNPKTRFYSFEVVYKTTQSPKEVLSNGVVING